MQALVIESRTEFQDTFLEVLSWFNSIKFVQLARDWDEIPDCEDGLAAIVAGEIPQRDQTELVLSLRSRFPAARIIAAVDNPARQDIEAQLRRAGADGVIDTRISIWKTGLLLREILGKQQGVAPIANYSSVPGMWIEAH